MRAEARKFNWAFLSRSVLILAVLASFTGNSCGGGQTRAKANEAATRSPVQEPVGPAASEAAEREVVTLPEGSTIPVKVTDEIDSKRSHTGEMFSGSVDPSVLINDAVVIPRGTEAHIRLNQNKKGGHFHGKAEVSLELVSLIINGRKLEVESNELSKKKGALSAKGGAVAKKAPSGAAATAATGGVPVGAAVPVIAAFSAARVQVKPGSRIDFTLEAPFTFEKPPPSPPEQP